jgi:hypothetical protein
MLTENTESERNPALVNDKLFQIIYSRYPSTIKLWPCGAYGGWVGGWGGGQGCRKWQTRRPSLRKAGHPSVREGRMDGRKEGKGKEGGKKVGKEKEGIDAKTLMVIGSLCPISVEGVMRGLRWGIGSKGSEALSSHRDVQCLLTLKLIYFSY